MFILIIFATWMATRTVPVILAEVSIKKKLCWQTSTFCWHYTLTFYLWCDEAQDIFTVWYEFTTSVLIKTIFKQWFKPKKKFHSISSCYAPPANISCWMCARVFTIARIGGWCVLPTACSNRTMQHCNHRFLAHLIYFATASAAQCPKWSNTDSNTHVIFIKRPPSTLEHDRKWPISTNSWSVGQIPNPV